MAASTHAVTSNGIDPTRQLISDLEGTHTLPLWAQMAKYNPPAPNPTAIPHIWRYDEIKPHLLRAGDLITEKQAERRVLMLINPKRGNSYQHNAVTALSQRGNLRGYMLMKIKSLPSRPTLSTLAFSS